MLWWLVGGVARKPRARAAPRLVKRRATSLTRPAKWMPQTIASWYPFASDRATAALQSEKIELCGADTFPWRGSVRTTRSVVRVDSAASGSLERTLASDAGIIRQMATHSSGALAQLFRGRWERETYLGPMAGGGRRLSPLVFKKYSYPTSGSLEVNLELSEVSEPSPKPQ
jgi:hypothetical protein